MKRRQGSMGPAGWIAGIGITVGAAALLVTMLPSARRYLRMRAM